MLSIHEKYRYYGFMYMCVSILHNDDAWTEQPASQPASRRHLSQTTMWK